MHRNTGKHIGGVPKSSEQYLVFLSKEESDLLAFVMRRLDGISRSKAKAILSSGGVIVDDKVQTRHDFAVKPDMVVKISRHRQPQAAMRGGGRSMRSKEAAFRVVFEDEHLIVVDKGDEVLSMGVGHDSLNMKDLLDRYFVETHQRCHAHVVHRLDVRTSGLMVYAKSVEVQQMFVNNWRATVTDRRYVAVVSPAMDKPSGHVESWLKDTASFKIKSSPVDNGGKFASTDWTLLDTNDEFSLIELKLHTGRKNQIRVHMQVIGHPIVGDYKYGSTVDGAKRLCLHAYKLAFKHPVTGELLEFATPYPDYFLTFMNKKRKK